MSLPAENSLFAYGDYAQWPEGERWELVDGIPFAMSPAPSRRHQRISAELMRQIGNFLLHGPCEVYGAPFDVRLPLRNVPDEEVNTVVQPDIVVVCDPSRLDEKGCRGAPDLVIEIVSRTSLSRDMGEKLELYERHGVGEYWVVHPVDRFVMVFKMGPNGTYGRHALLTREQPLVTAVLKGLEIDLKQVFCDE